MDSPVVLGNHCWFAPKGTLIPGQNGIVVDENHCPGCSTIEFPAWSKVADTIKVSTTTTKNTIKARKPLPCKLATSKEVTTSVEREYTITGESLTDLGLELIFGCKFDPVTKIGVIDSKTDVEGWFLWVCYDQDGVKRLVGNCYGKIDVDGNIDTSSEDFIKPVFKIKQLVTPIDNRVKQLFY